VDDAGDCEALAPPGEDADWDWASACDWDADSDCDCELDCEDEDEDEVELELCVGICGIEGGVGWLGGVEQPAPSTEAIVHATRERSRFGTLMRMGINWVN